MNSFKKLGLWLQSKRSNTLLFIIFLVLLNLVGQRSFLRLDLTAQKVYSLSESSKELISALEDPLSVRVYFSKNLPSPYNNVESYLHDLLIEYKGQAKNNRFVFEFVDMETNEARDQAMEWGLQNVQIQEVKDTEVGLKSAWMGLVILYGENAEILDGLTSTDGLEYRLTTTISRMISLNDTLAGLDGSVSLDLYASSGLSKFNITGFNELSSELTKALETVNKRNRNRLVFTKIDPRQEEVESLSKHFGIQQINWTEGKDSSIKGSGLLGLVLSKDERFVLIPLELSRTLFGGYTIRGLGNLEESITDALQTLLSRSTEVAYVTGHGEKSLWDSQYGAYRLQALVKDLYSFKEYEKVQEIPSTTHTIVINGPTSQFTEEELYSLDQFLMRGGNLCLFLDPLNEILPDQQMMLYGAQAEYEVLDTGLDTILSAWGLSLSKSYVMDKTCYVAKQQGYGEVPLYYVPQLTKDMLNQKHPVSKNLAYVLFLQTGSFSKIGTGEPKGLTLIPIATSSEQAWIPDAITSLNPYSIMLPSADKMEKRNLAVLLEGKFTSAFTEAVSSGIKQETSENEDPNLARTQSTISDVNLTSLTHLNSSTQKGRVALFASSAITTAQVMDDAGTQPVAILIRNALDWLNGNDELIPMRTKGLSLNTLNKTSQKDRDILRAFNLYVLPFIVLLIGLLVWRFRILKRKRIQAYYVEKTKQSMKITVQDEQALLNKAKENTNE